MLEVWVRSKALIFTHSYHQPYQPLTEPLPTVTGCVECVHVYSQLEMQFVHFWPNAVNAQIKLLLYGACMNHILITCNSFPTIQSMLLHHMHTLGSQSGDCMIPWTNGSMTCKNVFLPSPQCVYLINYWFKGDESSVKPS